MYGIVTFFHTDHEMMRPLYVGEMNHQVNKNNVIKNAEPAFEKQVQLQTIPNPFSNQFTVRFSLAQSSMVIVNMYDAKGNLVKKVQKVS
jgi:hypothetical protein